VIRCERRVTDLEPDLPLSADSDSCSANTEVYRLVTNVRRAQDS